MGPTGACQIDRVRSTEHYRSFTEAAFCLRTDLRIEAAEEGLDASTSWIADYLFEGAGTGTIPMVSIG